MRQINGPLESKRIKKDHNRGEKVSANTYQMPDHKTGQLTTFITQIDSRSADWSAERSEAKPYNAQWTYHKTHVTGQIRRQIKGPVTYRSEDLPSDTRWMDGYKEVGTRLKNDTGNETGKVGGPRFEKIVIHENLHTSHTCTLWRIRISVSETKHESLLRQLAGR